MKISNTKLVAAFFIVLVCSLFCVVTETHAQVKQHAAHGRLVNDFLSEMQDSVTLVETKLKPDAKRGNVTRNAARTYEAFTLDVPIEGAEDNTREVIFIEDTKGKKIYEVKGFDFPRPFTDLAWSGNTTLVFDQWMQPQSGTHYGIDVRSRRLIAAASIPERGRKH